MVFCSLIASSAIRAFISALKLRRCLDFISAPFPRQRFYTLLTGPNSGEHLTSDRQRRRSASDRRLERNDASFISDRIPLLGANFEERREEFLAESLRSIPIHRLEPRRVLIKICS